MAAPLIDPAVLPALGLCSARIGGLMLIAPAFSARTVPVMVRTAFMAVLTFLLLPLTRPAPDIAVTAASLLGELFIGFALGLGAAFFLAAAELAGDVVAFQSGLSGASTLDPINQTNVATLGQFMNLSALALVLALDGHVVMVEALAHSLEVAPIGQPIAWQEGARALVGLGSDLFLTGVRIGAPGILAVLISNLALGVLARATPKLNVFVLAYPLQIAVGLFTLGVSLPFVFALFAGWDGLYRATSMELLERLQVVP